MNNPDESGIPESKFILSLLIDMGFSAVAIADRVGHESIDITYRYAHVFPSTQMEVVSKLNDMMIC